MFALSYYLSHGIKKGFGERTFRHLIRVLLLLKLYFRMSPGILLFWLIDRIRPRVSSRIIKFKRRRFVYGAYNLTLERSYKHGCRFLFKGTLANRELGPTLRLFVECVKSLYGKGNTLQLCRETHIKAFASRFLKKKPKHGYVLWNLLFGRYYLNIRSYWFNLASTKWRRIRKTGRQLLELWDEREYQLIRQLHLRRRIFEKSYKSMRKWLGFKKRFFSFDRQLSKYMVLWFKLTAFSSFMRQLKLLLALISAPICVKNNLFDFAFRGVRQFNFSLYILTLCYQIWMLKDGVESVLGYYFLIKRRVFRGLRKNALASAVDLYKSRHVEVYDVTSREVKHELDYRYELREIKEYILPPYPRRRLRLDLERLKLTSVKSKQTKRTKWIKRFTRTKPVWFSRKLGPFVAADPFTSRTRLLWRSSSHFRNTTLRYLAFEHRHNQKIRPHARLDKRLRKFTGGNLHASWQGDRARLPLFERFFAHMFVQKGLLDNWKDLRNKYFVFVRPHFMKNRKPIAFDGKVITYPRWDLHYRYQRYTVKYRRPRSFIQFIVKNFLSDSRRPSCNWEPVLRNFLDKPVVGDSDYRTLLLHWEKKFKQACKEYRRREQINSSLRRSMSNKKGAHTLRVSQSNKLKQGQKFSNHYSKNQAKNFRKLKKN